MEESLLQQLRAQMGAMQLDENVEKPTVLEEVSVGGIVKLIQKIASSDNRMIQYLIISVKIFFIIIFCGSKIICKYVQLKLLVVRLNWVPLRLAIQYIMSICYVVLV